MDDTSCYHCGLPVPGGADYAVTIGGERRAMCCPGCQAVAGAIVEGGLDRFYSYRTTPSATPEERDNALEAYDLAAVQADFVRVGEDGSLVVDLTVSGITCAACAWLIEHHLSRLPGVLSCHVNVSSHRCRVRWHPERLKLSGILRAFAEIGYRARPAGDVAAEAARTRENRMFLLRLGLAGLGMMQAGMIAVALYAGAFSGIDPEWRSLLRWISLFIATPVVLFSAQPFFLAALRNLRFGHLTMDVPVSLAIGLAYGASAWATITRSGEVYFDSVSMFTFFLLLGRYLEMRVRHRNEHLSGSLRELLPPAACRLDGSRVETVPVMSLKPGDRVRVDAGGSIPCDGAVLGGESQVVEALLTGEQAPVPKRLGDRVYAGTVNGNNPLEIRVAAVGRETRLAAVSDLVATAEAEKPRMAALADRLASVFVGFVLVSAAAVALFWGQTDPDRALWVTLSVLVVTCPCALSLATPVALTVATDVLRRQGFLIRKGHVIETLAAVDHCVFDKTGTLTLGSIRRLATHPLGSLGEGRLLALAAALERGSAHPIARAFPEADDRALPVTALANTPGQGVAGTMGGVRHAMGKPGFVRQELNMAVPEPPDHRGQWLLLARSNELLAWFQLHDEMRPEAPEAVDGMRDLGLSLSLLSGDRAPVVAGIARRLGIEHWQGGASPEGKLAVIREGQRRGERLLMVGDGINDAPVLGAADVSVAMGDAANLTRLHADSLLLSGDLRILPAAVRMARRTRRIIAQNLSWALAYNGLALPLAAAGWVPPWAAAIGMSASSLLVVINALRLGRGERPGEPGAVPAQPPALSAG